MEIGDVVYVKATVKQVVNDHWFDIETATGRLFTVHENDLARMVEMTAEIIGTVQDEGLVDVQMTRKPVPSDRFCAKDP